MPEYLYEFAALVTKDSPSQSEISKYMLSLRYHHRADLSNILSFSVLILSCNNLNYQKELNVSTIEQIFKHLILQADYFFILLTYSKLMPLLNWANGRPQRQIEEALGPAFREMTKPISSSKLSKPVTHEEAKKCLCQHLAVLQLLDSKNFFLFFFNLINGINQSLENDIDFYFMELCSCGIEQEGLISSSQLAIMQKNIQQEYGKLRKRKYQEEIIEIIYKWLEIELQAMFYEGQNPSNHLFMEIFAQVVGSQSNFSGTTLLQVLDTQVQNIQPSKARHFLQLVDTCLIWGTYKISTQTILFLVCTIFSKIHSKKLSIEGQVMMDHLLLWKEVAIKKQLPVKLLICLIEWLPFLYPKSITKGQQQPEILQLYRKEILRLENASQSSQISGLIVLVQELQYRKMEGIYTQLEEFHSQMEQPQKQSRVSKPSKVKQIDFHFNISGLSKSNSQINSLLNSLESLSQNNAKSRNIHLQILSKPQSQGSFGSNNSERSFRECVEIIMSLIELFDYHVKELSFVNSDQSFTSKKSFRQGSNISSDSNFLPVISTHHELSSSTGRKGLGDKEAKIKKKIMRDLCINATSYSEQAKKRMVKHRGLIIKKQSIQIGYLFDSKQSMVSFFVIFLKPVKLCQMRVRENSFKVKREKEWQFTEPKINKQYQISDQIVSIKLYSLQGVPNSERVVRSRLQLKIAENRKSAEEEIYDIPLAIFNLIEWLPITPADLPYFQQQPCLQTRWYSVCPKLIKHGSDYLRKYFSFLQDQKGNYLMKCRILGGSSTLVRLIVVLGEAKVQLVNEAERLVAMGLLEVIG